MSSTREVTQILSVWRQGDRTALDRLMPLVHDELHRIAERYFRRERANHTLQATALVNETYLKLVEEQERDWRNRAHFFGVAARMMKHILINHALALNAEKRGGGVKITLGEALSRTGETDWDVAALNDALTKLETIDPRKCRIVELRYFGGLTNEEIVEVLGVSLATVNRELRLAKAWLHAELRGL